MYSTFAAMSEDGISKEASYRAVSWNIHSCVGTDGRYDIDRICRVLTELNADIVGLQEVDWRRATADVPDPLHYMADALEMNAVEGANLHDNKGRYGNGLLTRFDVTDVERLSLAYVGREPRGALIATLDSGPHRIRTCVTHLGLSHRERRTQLETLQAHFAETDTADINLFLADTNEWLSHGDIKRRLTPVPFDTIISGRSFPSALPLLRLDCILASAREASITGAVAPVSGLTNASDHLPVVADICFTPPT